MFDRRFFLISFLSFMVMFITGFFVWKIFWPGTNISIYQRIDEFSFSAPCDKASSVYESIEIDMPVQAFLNRCASSSSLSMVRRVFVSQWIYYNQPDVIKLLAYGQGATSFPELQALLEKAAEKEEGKNNAISMIKSALKIIQADSDLIVYANKTLTQGLPEQLHMLRGEMMSVENCSKEYKKLKKDYFKALELWIEKEHGIMIDKIIAKI